MNPPPQQPSSGEASPAKTLILAFVLTWLGDFLFWPAIPGLSLALFSLALGAALFWHKPAAVKNRPAITAAALLAATMLQTAVEISFRNIVVLLSLLLVLPGETAYAGLRAGWPRWSEAAMAMLKAPGRWFWACAYLSAVFEVRAGVLGTASRFVFICLPALLVGTAFAALLGSGNAIFGTWSSHMLSDVAQWLTSFDFSLGRCFFWLVLATFALAFLRPAAAKATPRIWTQTIPPFPQPRDPNFPRWQSILVLAALNALFFAVNTIDALYLWKRAELPAGVSYSQFVHEGVQSLIAAVLLSALLLAAIFHQARTVSESPILKTLAHAWIAQNVVLIASVLLRLKRYVDAYQLTTQRVYVACFLLLVTAGFGLLALRIARSKSLNWLIFANAIATFCLFFVLQFADVAGWVANYNVSRWQRDPQRTLDLAYLHALGPSAWPALVKVSQTYGRPEASEAWDALSTLSANEQAYLNQLNWRSWQWRHVVESRRLLASRPNNR